MTDSTYNKDQEGEEAYHIPVLLQEVIEGLAIKDSGVYVDVTFGGGGHSKALLAKLGAEGRLLVFDQDKAAEANVPADRRITYIPQNFRHLQRFLKLHGVTEVDGILADLGVSSHQLNEAERGFSTRYDADLDMRMDERQELTAAKVLNTYEEARLHKMLEKYGEVTNAKTLAAAMVAAREQMPFKGIDAFKNTLYDLAKGNPKKYWAQVFQALRIEVNQEIAVLEELLLQLPAVLASGGRAVIISFHSLEDRLVKQFFKTGSTEEVEQDVFGNRPESPFKILTKKPITATAEEQKRNGRSRSAKLRIAEKK